MTLIKYNPGNKPTLFSDFLDRFFQEEFYGDRSSRAFAPQVDIAESDKEFEIQFHLPGVRKEDIKIEVLEDQLTVSGERKMENEKKEKNFRTVESYYGKFSRSFYLPDNANSEKIDASYKDGILNVTIPKEAKKDTTKKITIK